MWISIRFDKYIVLHHHHNKDNKIFPLSSEISLYLFPVEYLTHTHTAVPTAVLPVWTSDDASTRICLSRSRVSRRHDSSRVESLESVEPSRPQMFCFVCVFSSLLLFRSFVLIFLSFYYEYVCMYVCLCVCHMCVFAGTQGGERRALLDSLDLVLQAFVSWPMWMLGTELCGPLQVSKVLLTTDPTFWGFALTFYAVVFFFSTSDVIWVFLQFGLHLRVRTNPNEFLNIPATWNIGP